MQHTPTTEHVNPTVPDTAAGGLAYTDPGEVIEREIIVYGMTEQQYRALEPAMGLDPFTLGRYKSWSAPDGVYLGDQYDLDAAIRYVREQGLTYEQSHVVRYTACPVDGDGADRRDAALQAAYSAMEQAAYRYAVLSTAQAALMARDVFPTAATVTFDYECDDDEPGWSVDLLAVRDSNGQPLWTLADYLDGDDDSDAVGFDDDNAPIRDHLASALEHGASFRRAADADADADTYPVQLDIDAALTAAGGPWNMPAQPGHTAG